MNKVLLTSDRPLTPSATRKHFPKILTLDPEIITPPFNTQFSYLREDIAPAIFIDDDIRGKDFSKIVASRGHKYDLEPSDFLREGRTQHRIPNIFKVRTRKFSTLVHFNAEPLSLPYPQPSFIVFQENLEVTEMDEYQFMLYEHTSLPVRTIFDGYNYVATSNKISLFVKAQIIQQ